MLKKYCKNIKQACSSMKNLILLKMQTEYHKKAWQSFEKALSILYVCIYFLIPKLFCHFYANISILLKVSFIMPLLYTKFLQSVNLHNFTIRGLISNSASFGSILTSAELTQQLIDSNWNRDDYSKSGTKKALVRFLIETLQLF